MAAFAKRRAKQKIPEIIAALELGRRTLAHAPSERLQLRGPRDAASYLMPRFGSRGVEQFGIMLLDAKHRVMRTTVLSIGTLNSSVVEPRDVFRAAAIGGATAIVLFHNRPATLFHDIPRRSTTRIFSPRRSEDRVLCLP